MVHRLRQAIIATTFGVAATMAPLGSASQESEREALMADAARVVEILEAERARLAGDYERLSRRIAELQSALTSRPDGEQPAGAAEVAEIERLTARIAELEAVEKDDPREAAHREVLEAFLAVRSRLEPVMYPAQSFTPSLSVERTRRATDLRAGPDAVYPSRGRVAEDAPIVVLAVETRGPWRLIVAGESAGYVTSNDLKEFR